MEETKVFIEIGPELAGTIKEVAKVLLEHNKLAVDSTSDYVNLETISIGYELQRIFKLDLTKIIKEQIKHKK